MKRVGVLCLLTIWILSACGKETSISLDVEQLAHQLASQLEYDDQLTSLSKEIGSQLYSYTEEHVEHSHIYVSTGATTEEIAVFQCVDVDRAEEVEDKAKRRIEAQMESVRNYQPEELSRLENALVQRHGRYVVVSVSSDPQKAKEIIQENIQEK